MLSVMDYTPFPCVIRRVDLHPMCLYMHIHIHIHVHVHVHIHIHIYIHIYIRIYIYTYIHVYTYIYMYIYMYICTYIYIYIVHTPLHIDTPSTAPVACAYTEASGLLLRGEDKHHSKKVHKDSFGIEGFHPRRTRDATSACSV